MGPLVVGGELVDEGKEMAEALMKHYEEVYTVPRLEDVDAAVVSLEGPEREHEVRDVLLNEHALKEIMLNLRESSAPGPDGIPASLLKRCAASLAQPLTRLWRASYESAYVPERLKEGTVTPIYKGGDKGVCSNYRPVVLTSHVAKVFERLVAREVMDHLESEGLLSNYQHGFRRGRSCASQLAQHYQNVLRVLEEGYKADVVYLDFSKAFDRVDHGLLL